MQSNGTGLPARRPPAPARAGGSHGSSKARTLCFAKSPEPGPGRPDGQVAETGDDPEVQLTIVRLDHGDQSKADQSVIAAMAAAMAAAK